jgi:hypothetical protein
MKLAVRLPKLGYAAELHAGCTAGFFGRHAATDVLLIERRQM